MATAMRGLARRALITRCNASRYRPLPRRSARRSGDRKLVGSLRPTGGPLSLVCWPAPQGNQFVTIPIASARRYISLPQPGDPEDLGPFAFADPGCAKGILSRAGFGEIHIDRVNEKLGGRTLDETARMLREFGTLSSVLDEIDEKTRRTIVEGIRRALTVPESSGRAPLIDVAAWLVTARTR